MDRSISQHTFRIERLVGIDEQFPCIRTSTALPAVPEDVALRLNVVLDQAANRRTKRLLLI